MIFLLFNFSDNRTEEYEVFFDTRHDLVRTNPPYLTAKKNEYNWTIEILGLKPGQTDIITNVSGLNPEQ